MPLSQKLPVAKSGSQIDNLWPEKTNIESTAACRALPTYAKVTIHILKKYSLVMCCYVLSDGMVTDQASLIGWPGLGRGDFQYFLKITIQK